MSHTLSLFEELAPPAAGEPPRPAPTSRAEAAVDADKHLRAALRLSRAMSRFPDRSPQQTRAGLAICRHLQALLMAADEGTPPRETPPSGR